MDLLKEAMKLSEGAAGYTLSSHQSLVELRDQAGGHETTAIARLVESFIAKAPTQIVQQIIKLI